MDQLAVSVRVPTAAGIVHIAEENTLMTAPLDGPVLKLLRGVAATLPAEGATMPTSLNAAIFITVVAVDGVDS